MVTLCRAKMAGCSDRAGHLMACSKAAYLYSIIHQVLASNFGISLLRSLRAALYPGRGYVRQTPIRRVHRGHSSGSPWALTRRDTLIEMHTDVNAAPHASLSQKPKGPGKHHEKPTAPSSSNYKFQTLQVQKLSKCKIDERASADLNHPATA